MINLNINASLTVISKSSNNFMLDQIDALLDVERIQLKVQDIKESLWFRDCLTSMSATISPFSLQVCAGTCRCCYSLWISSS